MMPISAELARVALAPLESERPQSPKSPSKQIQLIAQLSTPTGAKMSELTALTGWQAHTVRGTISGALSKRQGFQVLRDKHPSGETRYRIAVPLRA